MWLFDIARVGISWANIPEGNRTDHYIPWRDFAWLWYEPLAKTATIEPTIKETLAKLRELGLKLGVLSNTFVGGHSLERHLEQVGILDFFMMRMYSYEFDFRKPDLRIFRIAAERLGEAAENILYVGDRIDKDIEPALRVGMQPVLKAAYTNAGKRLPDGAQKINHISELPGLIESINA
ncbi:HAD family hydrolase [Planctomycetota bacterium]